MKSAIGNSMVVYIILTVLVFMIAFFAVSISYSKAFRVNNAIVNSIEKNKEFDEQEVNEILRTVGYRVEPLRSVNYCQSGAINNASGGNYRYCVYSHEFSRAGYTGTYYSVRTYLYFDVPLMGNMFDFRYPINGQTRVIYEGQR